MPTMTGVDMPGSSLRAVVEPAVPAGILPSGKPLCGQKLGRSQPWQVGASAVFHVSAPTASELHVATVTGGGPYCLFRSDPGAAAVHAGVLSAGDTGEVEVVCEAVHGSFTGCLRNGVRSTSGPAPDHGRGFSVRRLRACDDALAHRWACVPLRHDQLHSLKCSGALSGTTLLAPALGLPVDHLPLSGVTATPSDTPASAIGPCPGCGQRSHPGKCGTCPRCKTTGVIDFSTHACRFDHCEHCSGFGKCTCPDGCEKLPFH
eukprot:gene5495-5488_t